MFYPVKFVEKVKSVVSGLNISEEEKVQIFIALEKHEEVLGKYLKNLTGPKFTGKEVVQFLNGGRMDVLYSKAKRYAEYEELWEDWERIQQSQEKTIIPSLFIDPNIFPIKKN